MVQSIEGNLPLEDNGEEVEVPLAYYNQATGERTVIGTAYVRGSHFRAELLEDYKYFFNPKDAHLQFGFVAPITEVKCGARLYQPKGW